MHVSDIRGHVVIVTAPMGSGKGALVAHVRKKFPEITRTISCTTRARRPKETDGVDYYFISREDFEAKVRNGEFIEWASYGGHLYGTLRSEFDAHLSKGGVVICEVEVQGLLQLRAYVPPDHRTIVYIDGGDWEMLTRRARARAPMSDEELALRHERYLEEVAHKDLADVVVCNRDGHLEAAKAHMEAIMSGIMSKISA